MYCIIDTQPNLLAQASVGLRCLHSTMPPQSLPQRSEGIASFRRLAAETLFSGVLTDINDTLDPISLLSVP